MKIKISFWNNKWLWTAILFCVAVLFSCLQPLQFVEGGEFTFFSMLALVLIGYFFGWKQMFVSTVAFIAVKIWIDWPFPNLKPDAEISDYIFGYGVLIIGGIIAHKKDNLKLGYIVAVILRYIESIINCLIFHYIATDSVWANVKEAFGYSALYVITEAVVTLIILFIPKVNEAIEYWKYVSNNDAPIDLDTY
jgi:thiamine transporter